MRRHVLAIAVATALVLTGCDASPVEDAAEEPLPPDTPADGDDGAAAPTLSDPTISLQQVAEGLTSPVAMAEAPTASGRLFIVDQIGLIRVVEDGELLDQPFLDVRDKIVDLDENYDERGLLGLAFHPDYAENGRFFVYYSAPLRPGAPDAWNNTSHLSEFEVSENPLVADPSSETVLMKIDEPQANHAGGTVAFGPDGYLYLSLGDGGGANDVGVGHPIPGNGQDTSTLLGSILRIDVDSGDPYGIPPDNPFVGGHGAEEIYAWGFRNPYRFSFDLEGENQLFVGDAGQNLFEEVSIVELGGNYGWRIMEGTHCFDVDNPDSPEDECPDVGPDGQPLLPPVIEFSHDEAGLVVVGGHVYRGEAMPELDGAYIFGDWAETIERPSGSILAAVPSTDGGLWPWVEVRIASSEDGDLGHYLQGFGQTSDGEMYVLVKDRVGPVGNSGQVLKIVPPEEG